MPVVLKNLTDRPVLCTLSSGEVLRLSPGQASSPLTDVEVKNNPKVDKLVAQRIIEIDTLDRRAVNRTTAGVGSPEADQKVTPEGATGATEAVDAKATTTARSKR